MATRLNAQDTKINDDMIISKLLATLPTEYIHFAIWESTAKTDRILENLTARLVAEEIRNIENQLEKKAVAFKISGKQCHRCHRQGHLTKDCSTKMQSDNREVRCFQCNKVGHLARACRENQIKSNKSCNICKKNNPGQRLLFQEKENS